MALSEYNRQVIAETNGGYRQASEINKSKETSLKELHNKLGNIVRSVHSGGFGSKGFTVELLSHANYLQTKSYLEGEEPVGLDEIAVIVDYAKLNERYRGDNTANLIVVTEAIDEAIHTEDISKRERILKEFQAFSKSQDQDIKRKLRRYPEVANLVKTTALWIHYGWAYGNGNFEDTWRETKRENRLKSFAVSYGLIDSVLRMIYEEPQAYKALTFNEIAQLDDSKIRIEYMEPQNEITGIWDRMQKNIQFCVEITEGSVEAKLIDVYKAARQSTDPIVNGGRGPLSKDVVEGLVRDDLAKLKSLSPAKFAGFKVQVGWAESQLKSKRVCRNYREGEEYGERETVGQLILDPRITLDLFLKPMDRNNNIAASAITGAYLRNEVLPYLDGLFGPQEVVDYLGDMVVFYDSFKDSKENHRLETFSAQMHALWTKMALWREGRMKFLKNRSVQFDLYRDLTNDTKHYDRVPVAESLGIFLAAFIEQCRREGKEIDVRGAVKDVINQYSSKIVPQN